MVQDFVKLTAQRILWKNHKTDKSLLNLLDFGKLLVNSALTGKIGHLGFSRCRLDEHHEKHASLLVPRPPLRPDKRTTGNQNLTRLQRADQTNLLDYAKNHGLHPLRYHRSPLERHSGC